MKGKLKAITILLEDVNNCDKRNINGILPPTDKFRQRFERSSIFEPRLPKYNSLDNRRREMRLDGTLAQKTRVL